MEFGNINEANLGQLRKLNLSLFPVRYNDKFYQNVVHTPTAVTQYAYWNGFVVGAICCRLEPPSGPGPKKLYIMTLGVLAAYRRRGIATKLVKKMLEAVENDAEFSHITEAYLHVQTNNNTAIDFYNRFGFEKTNLLKGYYKRIEPPDGYVLSKRLKGEEAAAGGGDTPPTPS